MKKSDITSYLSWKEDKNAQKTDLSLGFIEKGIPVTTAFSFVNLFMMLRRGKSVKIDHYKEIKSQLKKRLKPRLFSRIDLCNADSSQGILDHFDFPDSPELLKAVETITFGYDYLAKVGKKYHLVRTNHKDHKVLKTKDISGYLGYN